MNEQNEARPAIFYFLMGLLVVGVTFIGWNFGKIPGAIVGFLFSALVNGYAIQIKAD